MEYYDLPLNVQKAIDKAMKKRKFSDFYYTLERLNDHIKIYRSVFYDKVTKNEQQFMLRKKEQKNKVKEETKQEIIQKIETKKNRLEQRMQWMMDLKNKESRRALLME